MFKGVWKKLLRVDLSNSKVTVEEISESKLEKFIGGSALATKYLYDEVPARTPALDKENKLIFATGPFQGTSLSGSAKWV